MILHFLSNPQASPRVLIEGVPGDWPIYLLTLTDMSQWCHGTAWHTAGTCAQSRFALHPRCPFRLQELQDALLIFDSHTYFCLKTLIIGGGLKLDLIWAFFKISFYYWVRTWCISVFISPFTGIDCMCVDMSGHQTVFNIFPQSPRAHPIHTCLAARLCARVS